MKQSIASIGVGVAAAAFALGAAADVERDRAAILGMAGGYAVSFSFEEIITLDRAEKASEPHNSRAHELVVVVEDRPDFISLQHLLVVGEPGAQDVVKHWRQDWAYEPAKVLEYRGGNVWEWRKLPRKEREGKWSQTVFEVSDTPRYSGVAAWHHQDGYSAWESKAARPLPRRESDRKDYDLLDGINRHGVTAAGWTHEQDNGKIVLENGAPVVLGRERGFNTYTKAPDFDFAVATDYWNATAPFWVDARAAWAEATGAEKRFYISPREDGLQLSTRVFNLANEFAEQKLAADAVRGRLDSLVAEHLKRGDEADVAGAADLAIAKAAAKEAHASAN